MSDRQQQPPKRRTPFFFRPPSNWREMTEEEQNDWSLQVVPEIKRRAGLTPADESSAESTDEEA